MKHYSITLTTGEQLVGTAKEVADQLRQSSKYESNMSTRHYMFRVAKRMKTVYGQKVSAWSYERFVESLCNSNLVKHYLVQEKES